jgi:hypothetical protein
VVRTPGVEAGRQAPVSDRTPTVGSSASTGAGSARARG